MAEKTYPHRFQDRKSFEQRNGSSPLRSGPLFVPNRYQVSPSLIMEGSCVYSTSPVRGIACGGCCAHELLANETSNASSPIRIIRLLFPAPLTCPVRIGTQPKAQ